MYELMLFGHGGVLGAGRRTNVANGARCAVGCTDERAVFFLWERDADERCDSVSLSKFESL